MNKKEIHIACSSDDNYAQHVCVMLYSLLENVSKDYLINIRILDGGIEDINKEKIIKSLAKFSNKKITFIEINSDKYAGFKKCAHLTEATYYRLDLPNICRDIDKVIYLDCDLIVREDISNLWEIDLAGRYLLAAKTLVKSYVEYLCNTFNLPAGYNYFSAGVMVENLKKMREKRSVENIFNFLKNNSEKLFAADQDVLNVFFGNNFLEIDPRWNQTSFFHYIKNHNNTPFSEKQFLECKRKPYIIHFDGNKPWAYGNVHPLKYEYYKYLKKTEYRDFKPKKNYKNLFINAITFFGLSMVNKLPDRVYSFMVPFLKRVEQLFIKIK